MLNCFNIQCPDSLTCYKTRDFISGRCCLVAAVEEGGGWIQETVGIAVALKSINVDQVLLQSEYLQKNVYIYFNILNSRKRNLLTSKRVKRKYFSHLVQCIRNSHPLLNGCNLLVVVLPHLSSSVLCLHRYIWLHPFFSNYLSYSSKKKIINQACVLAFRSGP